MLPKLDLEPRHTSSVPSQCNGNLEARSLSELHSELSASEIAVELPSPTLTITLPSAHFQVVDMKRAQLESPNDSRSTIGDLRTPSRASGGTEQPPYTAMVGGESSTVLGIKASGHYLGQVEASCLHVR